MKAKPSSTSPQVDVEVPSMAQEPITALHGAEGGPSRSRLVRCSSKIPAAAKPPAMPPPRREQTRCCAAPEKPAAANGLLAKTVSHHARRLKLWSRPLRGVKGRGP